MLKEMQYCANYNNDKLMHILKYYTQIELSKSIRPAICITRNPT